MTNNLAKQTGSALIWKSAQLGLGQIISLFRTLILARLLVPEDFGLMAIALVTVQTILTVTDVGMVPALVQRTDLEERHYNAAWTVGLTRAVIITGIVVAVAPLIGKLFNELRAVPIIRVLALRPLFEATASIKVAELIRELRFRSLALIHLSMFATDAFVAIALASSLGVWALVVGALVGVVMYVVMSYILAPHLPRLCFDRAAVQPLIRYGRWIFLTGIVAVSGSALLQLVISRELGTASLGLYYLAVKLAFLPSNVSSKVIGEVAFPVYARLQSDIHQTLQAFRSFLTGMATFLFPVYALLVALSPALVQNVLGPRWEGTGPLIQLLAVAGLVGLFGDAIVPLFKGFGHPYKVVVLEAVQSFVIVILAWWLTDHHGLMGATFSWFPAVVVSQFVAAFFLYRMFRRPLGDLAPPLLTIICTSVLGAVSALIISWVLPGLVGFLTAGVVALSIVGVTLWTIDKRFRIGLLDSLSSVFPQATSLLRLLPVGRRTIAES